MKIIKTLIKVCKKQSRNLAIFCLMNLMWFVACQNGPDSTQGNKANVRSSENSPVDSEKQNKLRRSINALQNDPLGPSSLGGAEAIPTENTKYIIAQKEDAVPMLVEALKESEKPVLVGYAAYCLRQIKSEKGHDIAVKQKSNLSQNPENLTPEERFAFVELTRYLDWLKNKDG